MSGGRASRLIGVIACVALIAVASAAPGRAACTLGAVAAPPLTVQNGHFVFPVDVNGHEAHFILDTGAFAMVLTRASGQRLGVALGETDAVGYGVGGVRHIYRGRIRHMRIGGLNADGISIAGSDMLMVANQSSLDGLFGMNQMAAYDIDLDIVGQHFVLYEADGGCRTPTVAIAQPLYDVPLVFIENNRQADVDISVEGRHVRAVLDTGAPHNVMFRKTAMRLGVDLGGFVAPGHHTGHGIGPLPVNSFTHVFETVKIGNLEFHHMPIEIIDQADTGTQRVHIGSLLEDDSDGEAGGEGMLLGADFFQRVHVWISHSSQRLIMQYPPQPSVLPH